MRKLAARISSLPARLERSAAEVVTASAARAAETARQLVPVDSGELRRSISPSEASVTASAPHAAMVEFGTSRMAPRPFMLQAARSVRGEFVRQAAAAAAKCIKEM